MFFYFFRRSESLPSKRHFAVFVGIAVGYSPVKQALQYSLEPIIALKSSSSRYASESAPMISAISGTLCRQAIRFSRESISVP